MNNFFSFIAGAAVAWGGILFTYLLKHREKSKENKCTKNAFRLIFLASIKDFIDFYSNPLSNSQWNNSFWNDCYIDIAKHFPTEFLCFIEILNKTQNIHNTFPGNLFNNKEMNELLISAKQLYQSLNK